MLLLFVPLDMPIKFTLSWIKGAHGEFWRVFHAPGVWILHIPVPFRRSVSPTRTPASSVRLFANYLERRPAAAAAGIRSGE
jgi:hypothetical protein